MSKSYTALIVDGNKTERKNLSSVIKQNYAMKDVHSTSSASDAMAILHKLSGIDWVFLDNKIEGVDAFQLIKEIKPLKSTANAKYIMTSTEADRETIIAAIKAGIDAFIVKPFTHKVILEKMRTLVDGKSQRKARRINLLGTFYATVVFHGYAYKSIILDISAGGCKVKSRLYDQSGVMIYDKAEISLSFDHSVIMLEAELIRLERDPSNDEQEPQIISAFIFRNMTEKNKKTLASYLEKISAAKIP